MSPNRQDHLLGELGRVQRERDESADPRWEQLAHGELTPEQVDELRQEALRDPEAMRRWDLYRPLDAEAEERIVEALLARRGPAPRARARRRWALSIASLAAAPLAAAALLFFVQLDNAVPPPPPYRIATEAAEIPAAGPLVLVAGQGGYERPGATMRAEDADVVTDPTSLQLKPATHVGVPIRLTAELVQGDLHIPWDVRYEVSSSGALRIRDYLTQLPELAPGAWTLVFHIEAPDAAHALRVEYPLQIER